MNYYLFSEERGSVDQVGKKLYDFADNVVNGELHPIEFKIYLNKLKDVISQVELIIEDTVIAEAEKYKGETVQGYRVEVGNGGRYKYDHILDIVTARSRLKHLETQAQMAFKFHSNGNTLIDDSTGEIVTPADYVPSKTYVKLQKEKGS